MDYWYILKSPSGRTCPCGYAYSDAETPLAVAPEPAHDLERTAVAGDPAEAPVEGGTVELENRDTASKESPAAEAKAEG